MCIGTGAHPTRPMFSPKLQSKGKQMMFTTWASVIAPFWDYMVLGGYVMPPLVFVTLILWFGLGYRFSLLLSFRNLEPRAAIRMAEDGALTTPVGPLERAAALGVQLRLQSAVNLRDRLEDALGREANKLSRFQVLTGAVIAVAPLLGLLGTVSGMIETFASLGDMTMTSQSGGIAAGISQALLTTQFGLAVAIPGLLIRGVLGRRQTLFQTQIDEVKDLLCASVIQEEAA